jgi:methionine synthase II (cobalamin-independent)
VTAPALPWPPGTATGIGSLPGTDPDEAARLVVGELPRLPHLPELPDRGPEAGLTGRGLVLLTELYADIQPSGWRLVPRPGLDHRRARDLLARDLDAMEAAFEGHVGPVKTQVAGPWTLAATTELTLGDKALSDRGACRDIAEALADGLAGHVAELRRRVPGATTVLVQLDEPGLPAVQLGRVPTASGFGVLRVPEAAELTERLAVIQAAVIAADGSPGLHCCARRAPVGLARAAGARWLSVDLTVDQEEDEVGEALEAGLGLVAGLVPATGELSDPARMVAPVKDLWRRLGLDPEGLRAVAVSPTCGLAETTPDRARAVLSRTRQVAEELAQ